MPIGFDVNQPASMDAMVAALTPYASQNAAESDIPTNAQDYLNNSYQRLTGDQGSNIFNDVFNARTNAATTAAANPMMQIPASAGQPAMSIPNKWSDKEAANQSALMESGSMHSLNSRELQLPHFGAENYQDIQRRRAALLGVGDLFDKVKNADESSLSPNSDLTDTLLQREGAKSKTPGKIVAGDDLHRIVNNPEFQAAMRQNPQQAMKLYNAVTGGRDFETDRQAQVASNEEKTKQDQGILGDLQKTGKWNPILGTFTKMRTSKDLAGNDVQTEVPISDIEQAALDRNGGAMKALRIDNPASLQPKMDLGAHGLKPQEEQQFRMALFNWAQANPGGDINKAKSAIANQLQAKWAAQAKAQNPGTASTAGAVPGQPSLLDRMGQNTVDPLAYLSGNDFNRPAYGGIRNVIDFMKGGLNNPMRLANANLALFGSKKRLPLIPDLPSVDSMYPTTPMSGPDADARLAILTGLREDRQSALGL